ncbi:hypothetical protein [Burkholderia lata]|uniref:hypothetical protein n=1 Tax=Burkholderia lata (strain ATCC 17760 / DSM 23089 / LMG 22485 / NCIMB 9086 / R18194 / 383) TaxID=482957 RepID=UPI0015822875|nr:hypothetical protein [Burkholderia lata]
MESVLAIIGGIAAVVVISAFGATSAGTQPYKIDYMASWVQAIGSIAAIIGALWIALRQARQQRQAELDAACITVVGMIERLRANVVDLATISTRLSVISQFDGDPNVIYGFAKKLTDLRKWSSDEELAVIPLGGRCAANLAMCRDRLHLSAIQVKQFCATEECGVPAERRAFATRLKAKLDQASQMLESAAVTCERATTLL